MKTKNVFFFLMFSCLICNAQVNPNYVSRAQTEEWILNKIRLYAAKERYSSTDIFDDKISTTENNFSYSFKDDNLIIKSVVKKVRSNRYFNDKMRHEENNYSEILTIPLNKLTNKYFINEGYLVFSADYNAFVTKNSKDNYEQKSSWHGIRIDMYGEERFVEKFNKAMFHLLSFVKKSKEKDLF
jgi:hypothetical protein